MGVERRAGERAAPRYRRLRPQHSLLYRCVQQHLETWLAQCRASTPPLLLGVLARTAVHGRPRFAKLSVRDGLEEQIAPVHPDFVRGVVPLSLMGLAGWLPIGVTHSRCFGRFGFGQPRSDLFAIMA